MTNMIPTDLLPFVDHAVGMTDRWLFVPSLVVFVMRSSRIERNKS
jgi:hypothetical protein